MERITRRNMLTRSAGLAGALSMGVPSLGEATIGDPTELVPKIKVVVVGAHPDDPESGCGGSVARYSDLGHEVVIVYLTAGEAGIDGKNEAKFRELRPYSVRKACIGSRREARQAGKMQANKAIKRRVRITAPITAGSVGSVP